MDVGVIKKLFSRNDNRFTIPETLDGVLRSYYYEDVDVCIIRGEPPNFSAISAEDPIRFKQEPNNPHDSNAVMVFNAKTLIGYLYRGTIQDMVNDYLDRGDPIVAKVRKVDKLNKSVKIAIAFYNKSHAEREKVALESIRKNYKEVPRVIEKGYFLHKSGDEIFILNEDEILFSNKLIEAIKKAGIKEATRMTYISGNYIDYNFIPQDRGRFQIGRVKLRGKVKKIYDADKRIWREIISVDDALKDVPKWVKRAQRG